MPQMFRRRERENDLAVHWSPMAENLEATVEALMKRVASLEESEVERWAELTAMKEAFIWQMRETSTTKVEDWIRQLDERKAYWQEMMQSQIASLSEEPAGPSGLE